MRFHVLVAAGLTAASALSLVEPLRAGPAVGGDFTAAEACPAFRSKNEETNPGDVMTEPGKSYPALELNEAGGDWIRIVVAGAPVIRERWVELSCGTLVAGGPSGGVGHGGPSGGEPESTSNLLAVSWQPAFCEIDAFEEAKKECRALNDGELPHTSEVFTLHGLWPQGDGGPRPSYCGASDSDEIRETDTPATWNELPPVDLGADLVERLAVAMPGTMSFLERHEWHSHGSCYFDPAGMEGYYADSVRLLDDLNATPIPTLLSSHIGAEIATADIGAAFDAAFGDGARRKVAFICDEREPELLGEIRINLGGLIDADATLQELIAAAPNAPRGSCRTRVTIDAAGVE